MTATSLSTVSTPPTSLENLQRLFVLNVEHELRTPLTIAQGYAELLRNSDLGPLNTDQQAAVFLVVDRLYDLRRLVERLGTMLAVETRRGFYEPLSLAILIDAAVDRHRPACAKLGQQLEIEVAADLPQLVGDAYQLQQAFDCLLENAVRFTPQGGRITVRARCDGDRLGVDISDTGIGIVPEEQAHIFSGFYQRDMSSTRQYGGLGLGLTIAKAVIEAHGGQIGVTSQAGQGATFTVQFPMTTHAFYASESGGDGGASPRRILIVDDDNSILFTFQNALEQLPNCEVETAQSGAQALDLLAQRPYHLLITDYRMPDMDGLALAVQLRQKYPATAIVMITAFSTDRVRVQAEDLHIARVLDKPVGLTEIREVALEAITIQ